VTKEVPYKTFSLGSDRLSSTNAYSMRTMRVEGNKSLNMPMTVNMFSKREMRIQRVDIRCIPEEKNGAVRMSEGIPEQQGPFKACF
jgi:hypothetical protein